MNRCNESIINRCLSMLENMKNKNLSYKEIEDGILKKSIKLLNESDVVVICGTVPFICGIAKRIQDMKKSVLFIDRMKDDGLFDGIPIVSLDDVLIQCKGVNILFVIASRSEVSFYMRMHENMFSQYPVISFEPLMMMFKDESNRSKREFYNYVGARKSIEEIIVHSKQYIELMSLFEDDRSREILSRILLFRTFFELDMNNNVKSEYLDYLDEDIYHLNENETVVDLGGYDGDTAYDFMQTFENNNIESYHYYLFEPSKINFGEAEKNFSEDNRFVFEQMAVSDCILEGCFRDDGLQSTVKKNVDESMGAERISITTLDGYFKGKNVSLIKMDIEGEELPALIGGGGLINRCKPKLVICLYHKYDDIINIIEYVKQLQLGYKLYIRCHRNSVVTDFVLYAV